MLVGHPENACTGGGGRVPEDDRAGWEFPGSRSRRPPRKRTAFLERAIEQYGKATYNFAYRLTGNEADARDLTQDAFIRVYRAWRSFQPGTSFLSWIYRIVTNLYRDELRRKKGRFQEEIPEDNAPQEFGGTKPLAVDPIEDYMAGQLGEPLSTVARAALAGTTAGDRLGRYRGVQLPRDRRHHGMLDRNGSLATPSCAGAPPAACNSRPTRTAALKHQSCTTTSTPSRLSAPANLPPTATPDPRPPRGVRRVPRGLRTRSRPARLVRVTLRASEAELPAMMKARVWEAIRNAQPDVPRPRARLCGARSSSPRSPRRSRSSRISACRCSGRTPFRPPVSTPATMLEEHAARVVAKSPRRPRLS